MELLQPPASCQHQSNLGHLTLHRSSLTDLINPIVWILGILLLLLLTSGSVTAQSLTDSLVAHWKFDGNGNDASGRGHTAVIFSRPSGPVYTDDRFGNAGSAIYMNGVNDSIIVADHSDFRFRRGGYSISMWVRMCLPDRPSLFYVGYLVGKFSPSAPYYLLAIDYWGNITHVNGWGDRANNRGWVTDDTYLNDGRWHHLVYVNSDTIATNRQWTGLYVDGQLRDDSITQSSDIDYSNNLGALSIGHFGGTTLFEGAIDDLRMYNRPLSAPEVFQLYSAGGWPTSSPVDSSLRLSVIPIGDTAICSGDLVSFQRSSNADWYSWSTTKGLIDSTGDTIIASPATTTTYRLTAFRQVGALPCVDTVEQGVEITVVVRDRPTAYAGPDQSICPRDVVQLGSTTIGGVKPYRWEWSPSIGMNDSTLERPTIVAGTSQQYRLVVTDANGCTDTSFTTVTVRAAPDVDIAGGDTLYFCEGNGDMVLSADVTDDNPSYIYRWSGNGLISNFGPQVTAQPSVPTVYRVEVGDDFGGCKSIDSVLVIPSTPPQARAGKDQEICQGGSVELGVAEEPGLLYEWQPSTSLNNPNLAQPTATPNIRTTYVLRVTDPESKCWSEDTVVVDVEDANVRADLSSLEFGTLAGCGSEKILTLQLVNSGTTDGKITGWRSDLEGVDLLDEESVINAGENTTVRIRFSPASSGVYAGTLVIYIGQCGDSLEVVVTGEQAGVSLNARPSRIDFGTRAHCDSGTLEKVFVVSNNQDNPATIDPGLVESPYSIVAPQLPLTLKKGEQVELTVRFAPQATGNFPEEILLPYRLGECADTLRVELRGELENVNLEAALSTLDFGSVEGCAMERDSLLLLRNPGSIDITLQRATLPADFQLLENLPLVIRAGEEIAVRLRYRPNSGGAVSGQAILEYQPCNQTMTLTLAGENNGPYFEVPDTVDFGDLLSCEGTEKEVSGFIRLVSQGMGDGSITEVLVDGPFSGDLTAGDVLRDGEARQFAMRFVPTNEGDAEGFLELHMTPCGVVRRVYLKGRYLRSMVESDGLDFGMVPRGKVVQDDVIFVNSGSHIEQIAGVKPLASPFREVTTKPLLPVDLNPGDTLWVTVEYTGSSGVSTSEVELDVRNSCSAFYTGALRGEGRAAGRCRLVLPQLGGSPGEGLDLVARVEGASGIAESGGVGFIAEVTMESSLLVVSDGSRWREEGDQRIVEINGDLESGMARMTGTLGRVEETPLRLISLQWLDGDGKEIYVEVDTIHGKYVVEDLCREGGVRLYNPDGQVGIKSVSPNPGDGRIRITYDLVESGTHQLQLVDVTGRLAEELFDGMFVPGVYELEWSAEQVSSGVYWLVLRTPTLVIPYRIDIQK